MEPTGTGRLLSGRYRLSAVIGQGGMGVVWKARDEALERDVAVKELVWPPHFTESEQQIACRRAVREAQMAGRIAHLNVVRIYDILEEDGHPWIIMEFLPYQSLRELMQNEGPLAPARAARVGLGVLAALNAAHAENVLHRDVKPANILVGPDGRVVLTDFGIARATDSPTLTTAHALVGSPSYVAPERARGGVSKPAGDLWGLGISLYAAVEGHPPFERDAPLATLTAVVVDEPAEAVHAGPLWPVISGLLSKDPDERLGAAETERMLREVAEGNEAVAFFAAPSAELGAVTRTVELPGTESAVEPDVAEEPYVPEPAVPEPAVAESAVAEPAVAESTVAESTVAGSAAVAESDPVIAAASPDQGAVAKVPEVKVPEVGEAEPTATSPSEPPVNRPPRWSHRPRWSRRLALALAALVAAVVAVTATTLALTSSPGHPTAASTGTNSRSAGHGAASRGSSTTRASASPAATGSSGVSKAGYGALPAGYYRFTNSTGFSIGVPDGWQISHDGHYVYITDPSDSGVFLLIDQSDTPKPNPLADWEQQAADRADTYPDYHLVRLQSVSYPQAEKAADWEFTYVRSGVPVHILNRNVLANAHHAYALYWSTPESDWDADYHYFQAFAATFQPAAVNQDY